MKNLNFLFYLLLLTLNNFPLFSQSDSVYSGTIYVKKPLDTSGIVRWFPTIPDCETEIESSARFEGSIRKYFRKNMKIPLRERFRYHGGYITFSIDIDTMGNVLNPKMIQWVRSEKIKDEAWNALLKMPVWQPALDKCGNSIGSWYNFSIFIRGKGTWLRIPVDGRE